MSLLQASLLVALIACIALQILDQVRRSQQQQDEQRRYQAADTHAAWAPTSYAPQSQAAYVEGDLHGKVHMKEDLLKNSCSDELQIMFKMLAAMNSR